MNTIDPNLPYVGQPVRYYASAGDAIYRANGGELAGFISKVWTQNTVNVAVFDASGMVQAKTSVWFGKNAPDGRSYVLPVVEVLGVELAARDAVVEPARSPLAPARPASDRPVPRVWGADIDALMETVRVQCHHFPGTSSTVAIAALPDGFVLGIGHSACVSPGAFDAEIGARLATTDALKKAREKAWELEGYLLRDRLARASA